MFDDIEWEISAGGQTETRYYPSTYTYDDVREDLINNCYFPINVKIKKLTT